ncbi:hypothetical protein M885DRAFT_580767, partial [Pelagophyceae sp. CCMP2097]
MYRELASVLRRKYGVRVLMPIDQISANVKTQLSPASSGTISIDVEVTVKDSVTRKDVKKKTAQKGGKPVASFKFGFIVLNQDLPQSPLSVKLVGVVHGADTHSVLEKTVMTPGVAAQLAELKQSVVVHVVSAAHCSDGAPGCLVGGSDAAHGCLVIPKKIVVATTTSASPVFMFLGDNDTLRTAPGLVEAPASECMGVLVIRDDFIIGLAVIHRNRDFGRSLVLSIAALGGCLGFNAACTFFGDVVAFYGLAEQLHRGGVVFVETLELAQKLTADHELYRAVFGQQGSTARNPCWACETKKLDERNEVGRAKDRTHASLVACAALFPKGYSKRSVQYTTNAFCSIDFPPLLNLEPVEETSKGPLHLVLGEFIRIYAVLALKCAEIDGVVDAAAAARVSGLLLANKERCAELDRAVVEVSGEQDTLEKALAAATARVDAASLE